VKTALAVLETLKIAQKLDIQSDFGVGPIEYIYIYMCVCVRVCVCVVHGQVKKNKIYIWLEAIRIKEHEYFFA
jgi:hypothetical protein